MDITSSESLDASENTLDVVDRVDESPPTSDNEEQMEVEQSSNNTKLRVLVPDENTSDVFVPTSPSLLVPSLKGKMVYSGGLVTCKGSWAMSDAAHELLGQTSEFEFKLVKADEGSTQYPFSGKYQGWFMLKQPPPMKGSVKIDDKEMKLSFVSSENGSDHSIQGQGFNKFGSFNLRGTLMESGDVHVYREYYTLAPLSSATNSKRKQSFSGGSPTELSSADSKRKSFSGSFDDSIPQPPMVSPRESSGRVRKVSTLMREYEDTHTHVAPLAKTPTSAGTATPKSSSSSNLPSFASSSSSKTTAAPPALMRQESQSDRTQRISAPLKKCGELLKEIAKHPQAVWFLEPVDYIKFGIPDYPTIVKQPMDFRTIRLALEALKYESHEAFAEHVRLVFKNAMTFNQLRDNPVHIAAREMSARFEDRYRQLITQIGVYTPSDSGLESRPSHSVGAGRPSLGGSGTKKKTSHVAATKQPALPGPRPMPVAYLGGGADNSSHQIMEMQRMMAAMQEEINLLRSAVRENEIVKRLHETKDAAHNPLTFEEKKKLIAQIHKLPPSRMEQVLEIIQAAIPKSDGDQDGDIEVPLDALDTFTLRKLQRFIEDNQVKKKPPAGSNGNGSSAPQLQRQSSTSSVRGGGDPSMKKPRAKSVSKSNSSAALMGSSGDMGLFDNEELLFSTDCFDEMRAESAPHKEESPSTSFPGLHQFEQHQSSSASEGQGGEEYRRPRAGSLDEDFEDLMDMKSPGQGGESGGDFNVHNADAWQMGSLEDSNPGMFASEEVGNSNQSWDAAQQEVIARKAREGEQRLHF